MREAIRRSCAASTRRWHQLLDRLRQAVAALARLPAPSGSRPPSGREVGAAQAGGNDRAAAAAARSAVPAGPVADENGEEGHHLHLATLSALAFLVGIIAGVGAMIFRDLIGLIHNLFFVGKLGFHYDANLFTPPSPWGAFIILAPVIGALAVTFLVVNFAPEAKGHGVPEVMDAIYYLGGRIRPIVAVIKSLASAIAIGTGAAVGREGPIIQIGAAFGSALGQVLRMPAGQRIVLVAAGAGGGIAATFNTPIGGVMFAIELMLPEVSIGTFLPVSLATGTATYIGRLAFGDHPSFLVPANLLAIPSAPTSPLTLALYVVLGALIGLAAAAFIRGLSFLEGVFNLIPGDYRRHAFGMLLVGLLMYGLFLTAGHYYIEGVGYATVQATLYGELSGTAFFLLLFVAKLFATCTSLGSGSSGGIFSPCLFMGGTLGAAFATAALAIAPGAPVSVPAFTMVGMGAMMGGATGAAMTAVTMIFEMTRDYTIMLPMILAVALSLGVRRALVAETIYTMKLYRRGKVIPKALQTNLFLIRRVREVMERDFVIAPADMTHDAFISDPAHRGRMRHVVVTEDDRIIGVMRVNTALHPPGGARSDITLGDLASRNFIVVREENAVFAVIRRMRRQQAMMALVASSGPVLRARDVVGVVTKEHVADAIFSDISVYPD